MEEYTFTAYFGAKKNTCLDWDTTLEWFELLGIEPVPVMYDGIYDETIIKGLWKQADREKCEGYVIRLASEIQYSEFRKKVAKYVRKNHVQTVKHHWMAQTLMPKSTPLSRQQRR